MYDSSIATDWRRWANTREWVTFTWGKHLICGTSDNRSECILKQIIAHDNLIQNVRWWLIRAKNFLVKKKVALSSSYVSVKVCQLIFAFCADWALSYGTHQSMTVLWYQQKQGNIWPSRCHIHMYRWIQFLGTILIVSDFLYTKLDILSTL